MKGIDHLLIGTSDLAEGVSWVAERLGVTPTFGGCHPRWGTANYLLSLGPGVYLEVLGPDPEAEPGAEAPLFGIDSLTAPRLVTWAAKGTRLEALAARAGAAGVELGAVRSGSRTTPDGSELTWTLTDPGAYPGAGLVPFFIDWGATPHPSASAPDGGRLISLTARHPDPPEIRRMLEALGLDLPVERGGEPTLVARIRTVGGDEVELR